MPYMYSIVFIWVIAYIVDEPRADRYYCDFKLKSDELQICGVVCKFVHFPQVFFL